MREYNSGMDLLSGLNPQQQEAVTAPAGPTLVLAGPGSGKTRVLTHRIAYLIQQFGVAPHHIMAVTFTNKAAREMKDRLEKLLNNRLRGLQVGTFHALCARLLRREAALLHVNADFVIFDTSDQETLVKQVLKELNLDDKKFKPSGLLNKISSLKNELIAPADFAPNTYLNEITRRVYVRYQELLAANNALDFDDLLTHSVWLLQKTPDVLKKYQALYEHVLVDEFQDTNTAQYALLKLLTDQHHCLYAVGDPDQSIYRWRGADYRNVRRLEKDFPAVRVVLLEDNYRSTQTILDAAMAVIDQHPGRTRKQLRAANQPGGVKIETHEAYNDEEEARYVVDTIASLVKRGACQPGDCAVMYRTNAQSRAVEEAFIRANLPYRLVGAQRFYGRKEVKDVLAYLRLIHNPADSVSLMRVINTPPRGIGAKTLDLLNETAAHHGLSATDLLRQLGDYGPKSALAASFGAKAAASLATFGLMLNHWITAKAELSVAQLMDAVLARIDYTTFLEANTEEGRERWENVQALRGVAAQAPEGLTLADFLNEVALVSDQDTISQTNAPTLLTLHAAKGLEFPVVFLVGLDDGVLPHQRSLADSDPEALHEERRLLYVGMTRAKDRLYLLRAFRRSLYGDSQITEPSRFLDDIPARLMAGALGKTGAAGTTRATSGGGRAASYGALTRWDKPAASAPAPKMAPPRFATGQRVSHDTFGEGIITSTRGRGDDEEVEVQFEKFGRKRLLAAYANLKPLSG